ncbi:capsule polysaccharide biosynthesis family protein [Bacteroides fragilis str. 3719 T6]|nr:capsule polysaccharide biosynthesis family protein [Bacteroides fragilis str. 3719 T6]
MDLYTLPYSYKNVTIISPVDIIDSYALMNAGDKIVVFTSSMGVEASYWGKPVILLGNTFYYDLDICYKPSNKKEIYSLIVSQLEPKSNLDSIKYAYYLFHRYDCERWKYVDFDEIHFNLLGKDIECANYQKFMGSNFLFAIRHLIIIGIVKLTSLFKL